MPVQMIARKRTTYANRDLRPGDTFEASSKDAAILIAIGAAKEVEPPAESDPVSLPSVDMLPPEDSLRPQRRRQYRRRDMAAEGSDE